MRGRTRCVARDTISNSSDGSQVSPWRSARWSARWRWLSSARGPSPTASAAAAMRSTGGCTRSTPTGMSGLNSSASRLQASPLITGSECAATPRGRAGTGPPSRSAL